MPYGLARCGVLDKIWSVAWKRSYGSRSTKSALFNHSCSIPLATSTASLHVKPLSWLAQGSTCQGCWVRTLHAVEKASIAALLVANQLTRSRVLVIMAKMDGCMVLACWRALWTSSKDRWIRRHRVVWSKNNVSCSLLDQCLSDHSPAAWMLSSARYVKMCVGGSFH